MHRKDKGFLKTIRNNKIYLWIFFVITIVFVVVWVGNKIYPLKEHTLILSDGIHQYIPFFSEYYEKIKNGENLLFSSHVGMGNNFFSLFSYYLTGPLNLLVFLFPKDKLYFSFIPPANFCSIRLYYIKYNKTSEQTKKANHL